MSVTVKSNSQTAADIEIKDVGIIIPKAGGNVIFTSKAELLDLARSEDLVILATDLAYSGPTGSTLIINNGVEDIPEGVVSPFVQNLHIISDATGFGALQRDKSGNFSGVTGSKGDTGSKGATGDVGETGPQGQTGDAGLQSLTFSLAPTDNRLLSLLGWYIQTDTAVSLTSASPITVSDPGYHSHITIDVSSPVGTPFTIRVTGTSINEADDSLTPGDTEDLSITAAGYYQSTKSWITAVQLSIVEASKSCTLDVYRISYWDHGNTDFTIKGCRLEIEPDSAVWDAHLKIYHIQSDGSYNLIDNKLMDNTQTPPRAETLKIGKYKRTDYNQFINGSGSEGIIIELDQKAIRSFFLEVTYE